MLIHLASAGTPPWPPNLSQGGDGSGAGLSPSAGPPTWTLDDARSAFLRGAPELVEAAAKEAAAAGDLVTAGLLPNPQLNLSPGNLPLKDNREFGNGPGLGANLTLGAGVSQLIELGGKRDKRLDTARGGLAQAKATRLEVLRQQLFALQSAFYKALVTRAKRELVEKIHDRYGETVRISRARFKADDISAAELDKIELEGLKFENAVADARQDEAVALQDLLQIVGPLAPATVIVKGELPAPRSELSEPELVHRALDARPDLVAARHRVETARAALALARAQAIPDLTVGLGYTHSQAVRSGDNPDALYGSVTFPLPLFNRNQGEVMKAEAELAAAEHAEKAVASRIEREVLQALAKFVTAAEKVARYEGGYLDKADRALKVTERSYREGAQSLLVFLEAERTYAESRADYLDTQFEHRQALLELERAVGGRP